MYTIAMKMITLLLLFSALSFAIVPQETQKCKDLYAKANAYWIKLEPILRTKIASRVGWDLIHTYLDAASTAIGECEPGSKLDFRYIRELKQGMKRADKLRDTFWVQTYDQMVAKARREGKCTNIYRSYGK